MELPEYIEKCRQITDACGWPEDAKDMALRNAILLGLKNPMVYRKCLEENQDTLTAERIIEIATDIYNSDCQRSIMQTLSTALAAVTAIQQGSSEVHKLQASQQEHGKLLKDKTKKTLRKGRTWRELSGKTVLVAELGLLIPNLSVQPETWYVTSVGKRGTTKSVANPRQNQANTSKLKYMACRHK